MMKPTKTSAQSGQSLLEYVLLLSVVIGMGTLATTAIPQLMRRVGEPFRTKFAMTYKYGHPEACGFENDPPPCDGTPKKHPRYYSAENSRVFSRK